MQVHICLALNSFDFFGVFFGLVFRNDCCGGGGLGGDGDGGGFGGDGD
jgi:hypothetical protein